MPTNKRFGDLLNEGIYSVSKRQKLKISEVQQQIADSLGYSTFTVESWRRGKIPPKDNVITFLIKFCFDRGRVGPKWVESTLIQARYLEREDLIQELFPNQPIRKEAIPHIHQNLPPRYGPFLGRDDEMAHVIEGLGMRWPILSIEGLGGVGKTSLALEVARLCLSDSSIDYGLSFDGIVWVSAKDQPNKEVWLEDVLDTVSKVLDYPFIMELSDIKGKLSEIDNLLRLKSVLMIIDNFETIKDPSLEDWLFHLPEPSRALLTSRYNQLRTVWPVHLKGLEQKDAIQLIQYHARRLNLVPLLDSQKEDLIPLIDVTDGNPKAIEMALGYINKGVLSYKSVVDGLYKASLAVNEIFDYLFSNTWNLLNENARHVLLCLSLFSGHASKDALANILDLQDFYLDKAIKDLGEMFLLEINNYSLDEQRYHIHPLTLAYLNRLKSEDIDNKTLINRITQRFNDYFIKLVADYCSTDYWESYLRWQNYPNIDKEFPLISDVFDDAYESKDWQAVIHMYNGLVHYLARRSQWDKRINWGNKALTAARNTDYQEAEAWYYLDALAWVYIRRREDDKALHYLKMGKQIAQANNYQDPFAHATNHQALVALMHNNQSEAKRLLQSVLHLDELTPVIHRHMLTYWGRIMRYESRYERAKESYELALALCDNLTNEADPNKQITDETGKSYVLLELGKLHLQYDEFDLALTCFENALSFENHLNRSDGIASAQLGIAQIYAKQGKIRESFELASDSKDRFARLGMHIQASEAEEILKSKKTTSGSSTI